MTPDEILHGIYERAVATLNTTVISNQTIRERVDYRMLGRGGFRTVEEFRAILADPSTQQ